MNYFNQESERLIYRALTEKDIDTWIEFFENNDRLVFLGIDLNRDNKIIATEWITKQLERYENQGLGHLAAIEKSTGEFIGMGGILPRALNGKTVHEIAYSLIPKYWNKGFGTEIARQMKHFGQQHKIAPSFISIIDKNNVASINVAKKNNMIVIAETEFMGMEVFVYGDAL
ncbi:MAG: GNAT family N-acetyltransferase [Bacteroidia bacterium]|nr:GNAT family N-acetyltransferase [Bacteroidia bacterium]